MDTQRCFRQDDKTVFHRYLFRTADHNDCERRSGPAGFYMDLFYMMEQLTTLRPEMLQRLLETTKSLKVKRMFLYMAEKAGHYWLDALDMSKIELGTSKLQLAKNGVYISKYKITVPKELNEYE